MPQVLEAQGGWTNRKIIDWFSEYVDILTKEYGSKVKNWMVMNEQLAFTGNGYMNGVFAPGKKSIGAFMKAVHYAMLANAEGGRIIRKNVPEQILVLPWQTPGWNLLTRMKRTSRLLPGWMQ